ncbi:TRAP transporter small permease subunit [Pararhodospirillum photometricum]|uniref:TRAP transporter small permease protein n=1 Tax=Pararhodospirillum photometricum DSM 122 TaxID=1150469 RepID=H6SPI9_PARPM|nr:TRAP transporter small permease subunit [Pararhodospirillum photometricum]CCG09514.1 Putative uncharacterized protein [Pararhodospirillum photometricum DSM 122]
MTTLTNAFDALALWMFRLAGVLLLIMGGAVLVDVAGRALLRLSDGRIDMTFVGGPEVVAYTLMFTVLFGLPHAVDRGQVVVDVFTEKVGERTKERMAAFYYLGFALLGAGLAFRLIVGALDALNSGLTTQVYQVPMAALFGPAAFATLVLALRALLVAGRTWRAAGALPR